jgi:hypothetical protein
VATTNPIPTRPPKPPALITISDSTDSPELRGTSPSLAPARTHISAYPTVNNANNPLNNPATRARTPVRDWLQELRTPSVCTTKSGTPDDDLEVLGSNTIGPQGTPEMWVPLPVNHLRRGPSALRFSIDMQDWNVMTRRINLCKRGLVIGTYTFPGPGDAPGVTLEVAAFYGSGGIILCPAKVPHPNQPFSPYANPAAGISWRQQVPKGGLALVKLHPLIKVAVERQGLGINHWIEEYLRVRLDNGFMAWPTHPVWEETKLPHNRVTYVPR